MNKRMTLLILAPLALTMSCATRQSAPTHDTLGPRLIACADTNKPKSNVRKTSVELRYDVNTEGRVTAVRALPSLNSTNASVATIAAARDLALTCMYEPATRNGQPVVVTVTRWVSVETPVASRP